MFSLFKRHRILKLGGIAIGLFLLWYLLSPMVDLIKGMDIAPEDLIGNYAYGVDHYVELITEKLGKMTSEETVIEFNGTHPFYYDPSGIGRFRYQLSALYALLDCGFSQPATTPNGEDFVMVTVTEVPDQSNDPIVTILNIYTLTGQRIPSNRQQNLGKGIYLLEGLTTDGRRIHRKITITQ